MAWDAECERQNVTARLAYELWERRGHPIGSPEIDWLAAEQILAALQEADIAPGHTLSMGPNEVSWR
jgi:hypothetical protein